MTHRTAVLAAQRKEWGQCFELIRKLAGVEHARDRELREWRKLIRERANREWRELSPDVVEELAGHLAGCMPPRGHVAQGRPRREPARSTR